MADGVPQPQRLERLSAEIVAKLRLLRDEAFPPSELCGDLAFEVRDRLGPTERLFLAGACAEALDDGETATLVRCLTAKLERQMQTCEEITRLAYRNGIQQAREAGDEAKAQKLEAGLADYEARLREREAA